MPDNYRFDMTGVDLELALRVAFQAPRPGLVQRQERRARYWSERPAEGDGRESLPASLVLHWTKPYSSGAIEGVHEFPVDITVDLAVPLVSAWLEQVDYPREPGHDGSNSKGWRVYNEAWGHIGNDRSAFVAIEPAWLMHGK